MGVTGVHSAFGEALASLNRVVSDVPPYAKPGVTLKELSGAYFEARRLGWDTDAGSPLRELNGRRAEGRPAELGAFNTAMQQLAKARSARRFEEATGSTPTAIQLQKLIEAELADLANTSGRPLVDPLFSPWFDRIGLGHTQQLKLTVDGKPQVGYLTAKLAEPGMISVRLETGDYVTRHISDVRPVEPPPTGLFARQFKMLVDEVVAATTTPEESRPGWL